MILTAKSRYAIMAILEIASTKGIKPVPLADIAKKNNIDLAYLEQIFVKLRKSGLVSSSRGPGGGYLLNINQADLKIADIIDAVAENLKMTKCEANSGCLPNNVKCNTHHLWEGLGKHIREYFNNISVADLING